MRSRTRRAELLRELFRYACMLFAVPVLLLLGGPLLESTLADLRQMRMSTDALLSLGVLAAYAYSFVSIVRGGQHIYFEVGSMILVAVTLGRWLEASGKQQATRGLQSLQKLIPETVRLVAHGTETTVATDAVRPGDVVRVMPAERIPLDGQLINEQAEIDQQIITGESDAILKCGGDDVYGGSVNGHQEILVRVKSHASAGIVQRMIDAVQQAALSKNSYQRLVDRVAAWFVPMVMVLALAVFAWHTAGHAFQYGLLASLSILLIACPCAMAIATPLAVWTALTEAARRGVLFRNGDALLQLASAHTFLLDKTGTLTTGRMLSKRPLLLHIDPETAEAGDAQMVADVAVSLATASRHPLCQALCRHAGPDSRPLALDAVESIPGQGMKARLPDGALVVLGNLDFVTQMMRTRLTEEVVARLDAAGVASNAGFAVGWNGRLRGYYAIREELRPGVKSALDSLRQRGLHVAVLTGDRQERAECLQRGLQLDVQGEMLPADKLARVHAEQSLGRRVAFVGDGVNDAPALAAADVGIAMSCGADVTREAASVCLLGNDLAALPRIHELARATARTIRGNLLWAFAYNLAGIGFAVTGKLNPILAAAAMVASSLYVISNSLRLKPFAAGLWPVSGETQGTTDLSASSSLSPAESRQALTSGVTM